MPMPRALKWIGLALGGLLAVIAVFATVLGLIGRSRLHAARTAPAGLAAAEPDSATLARGEHLMQIHSCQGCHGEDLGGTVVADMPLGRFVAPNLTAGEGGVGTRYADGDWDRAIRFGVRPDSSNITPFMPYPYLNNLSDDDARALFAYLRQLPPVDNVLPATAMRIPGYLLIGISSKDELFGVVGDPPASSPRSGTAAYGAYLASTTCTECHGADLQGAQPGDPDSPPAPSLIPAGNWPLEAFAKAVRTGEAPAGRRLTDFMPWNRLQHLTDDEVAGLHAYLKTLGPGVASE